jgi:hypothetical protein
MSVDFFLQSKKIYKHIEHNLREIVELYKEFIELTENEEGDAPYSKDNDILFLKKKICEYEEKISEIHNFKDYINTKIVSLCNHNIVEDSIDISPDLSQEIKYCTHCEYTINEK